MPLAGPASRGGRLIANNILGSRRPFAAPLGTAIIRVFELTAACTGLHECALQRLGIPYETVHLHPNSHARYFPGSERMALKLLFDGSSGKILGAQAIGKRGVDKRIDVIATAISGGLTVRTWPISISATRHLSAPRRTRSTWPAWPPPTYARGWWTASPGTGFPRRRRFWMSGTNRSATAARFPAPFTFHCRNSGRESRRSRQIET